ncbi:MAG: extracellular solute-binding protein, partial [Anaerolineales bacterium]
PAPTSLPSQLVAIWLDWEPRELQSLYQVIELYQRDHPGINFAITYRPSGDLLTTFENAAESGRTPSILLGPSQWGPSLREKNYILNLSPLLDPGMESDVHAIAWAQASEGSHLYGLPLELQGMVLYRNRTLAAQPVATLSEWLTVADQLRATNIQAIHADMGLEISLPMMAACGSELFDTRGDLLVFNQGGTCWLELLSQIATLGRVVFNSEEDIELFKSGQAAWLIASSELRGELTEALGVTNLKIDPWPIYDATGFPLRGFTWSENAYLVAGSTELDLEASWGFLQFLFGPEGQEILSDPDGAAHIPSLSTVDPPDSLIREATSMLMAGVSLPLHGELVLAEGPLLAAIQAVTLQGADPAFALRMAHERFDLLRLSGQAP